MCLKHPKMGKIIVLEWLCGFGEKCAYRHEIRSSLIDLEHQRVNEDVKILKAEVNMLKKALESLTYIREECEDLKLSITEIKEEIEFLDASNREVVTKL